MELPDCAFLPVACFLSGDYAQRRSLTASDARFAAAFESPVLTRSLDDTWSLVSVGTVRGVYFGIDEAFAAGVATEFPARDTHGGVVVYWQCHEASQGQRRQLQPRFVSFKPSRTELQAMGMSAGVPNWMVPQRTLRLGSTTPSVEWRDIAALFLDVEYEVAELQERNRTGTTLTMMNLSENAPVITDAGEMALCVLTDANCDQPMEQGKSCWIRPLTTFHIEYMRCFPTLPAHIPIDPKMTEMNEKREAPYTEEELRSLGGFSYSNDGKPRNFRADLFIPLDNLGFATLCREAMGIDNIQDYEETYF